MRKNLNLRANIALGLIFAFLVNTFGPLPLAQAQDFRLPAPGTMVNLSSEFTPALLKGIVIDPQNVFKFDFMVYKGDKELPESQKKQEYTKLIKYFLASLAVPDEDQWVNLSPYEKNRIIKEDFGKTEMGGDLLAQDYLLKQITASLIYPQDKLGQKFWEEVYNRAYKQFGTTNIPVNTFNKVWIVPDEADIYEKGNAAYLYKSHLKVMLEEDYLSLEKHSGITSSLVSEPNKSHTIGSQVVREILLPQLEKEVNENKNFAPLRQVFSGMILAAWYKRALRESLLAKIYANKGKVKGVDQNPQNNEVIYQQYLKAYKKGVFNYIKEDVDKYTNETIPRKYFSGGTALVPPNAAMDSNGEPELAFMHRNLSDAAMKTAEDLGNGARADLASVSLDPETADWAMTIKDVGKINHVIQTLGEAYIIEHLGGLKKVDISFDFGNEYADFFNRLGKPQGPNIQSSSFRVNRGTLVILSDDIPQVIIWLKGLKVKAEGDEQRSVAATASSSVSPIASGRAQFTPILNDEQRKFLMKGLLEEYKKYRKNYKSPLLSENTLLSRIRDRAGQIDPLLLVHYWLIGQLIRKNNRVGELIQIDQEQFLQYLLSKDITIPPGEEAPDVVTYETTLRAFYLYLVVEIYKIRSMSYYDRIQYRSISALIIANLMIDGVRTIGDLKTISENELINSFKLNQGILKFLKTIIRSNGLPDFDFKPDAAMLTRRSVLGLGAAGLVLPFNGAEAQRETINTDWPAILGNAKQLASQRNWEDLAKLYKKVADIPDVFNHRQEIVNIYWRARRDYANELDRKELDRPNLFKKLKVLYEPADDMPQDDFNQGEIAKTYWYALLSQARKYQQLGKSDEVKELLGQKHLPRPKGMDNYIQNELKKFDHAMNADLGGIDMNAANLNMNIKRDGRGVPLPVSQQDLANIHIDGLVPVILQIKPASASFILSQLTN